MSLETGTRIPDLVATNPVGATDFVSQGDDHIRLIKACLQGSFPAIGPDAVAATGLELSKLAGTDAVSADFDKLHDVSADAAELNILDGATIDTNELNRLDGVTSGIQGQLDGKQPLDSDLTALAALTTAPYGRDFNVLADNAALASKIAAIVPTWTGVHTFTGGAYITTQPAGSASLGQVGSVPGGYGLLMLRGGGTTNQSFWATTSRADGTYAVEALNDALNVGKFALEFTRSGATVVAMNYGNATDLPTHTFNGAVFSPTCVTTSALAFGYLCFTGSNATLPNGVGGQWMLIINNSGGALTFTQAPGCTTYLSNLGVAATTFTVAAHGMALVIAGGPTLHFVTGDITGYT